MRRPDIYIYILCPQFIYHMSIMYAIFLYQITYHLNCIESHRIIYHVPCVDIMHNHSRLLFDSFDLGYRNGVSEAVHASHVPIKVLLTSAKGQTAVRKWPLRKCSSLESLPRSLLNQGCPNPCFQYSHDWFSMHQANSMKPRHLQYVIGCDRRDPKTKATKETTLKNCKTLQEVELGIACWSDFP